MPPPARRPLQFALLFALALALIPTGAASAAGCAGETLIPDAGNTEQIRAATRCLINQERAGLRRKPLAANPALTSPAQVYAEQMVRESFFDHVCPAGSSILGRLKKTSKYITNRTARFAIGENIAWGSMELSTPLEIVKSWMQSPGHRRNILDRRYRDVGIGVASGAPEDVGDSQAGTYTTVFGQRSKR